jgi:hypothetical protein
MNVVAVVTGPCVAGKDHADKTFFNRDPVTDFELRFVRTACDGSIWRFPHSSHCDAPGVSRTRLVEEPAVERRFDSCGALSPKRLLTMFHVGDDADGGLRETSHSPVWGHRWNLLAPILSEACADAGITNRVLDPGLLDATGMLVCVLRSSIRGEVLYTQVRGMVAIPALKGAFFLEGLHHPNSNGLAWIRVVSQRAEIGIDVDWIGGVSVTIR